MEAGVPGIGCIVPRRWFAGHSLARRAGMILEKTLQFRRGTQDGAVMDFGSIIQVLAGGYPGHPCVFVTAAIRRRGAPRLEPVEGCYAIAYPSVDEQYPVVVMSGARMQDAMTAALLGDCLELAGQMARRAWELILQGEAHVVPIRTLGGAMRRPPVPVRRRKAPVGESDKGDNVTPLRRVAAEDASRV
jgi:hypothetical protein